VRGGGLSGGIALLVVLDGVCDGFCQQGRQTWGQTLANC